MIFSVSSGEIGSAAVRRRTEWALPVTRFGTLEMANTSGMPPTSGSAQKLPKLRSAVSSCRTVDADADEMRQVAVGVKATAVHALLTAANVAGMSERLNSFAAVLEAVIPPGSEPPPSNDNEA